MILFFVSFFVVLALDLFSKYLVYTNMAIGESVPLLGKICDLCYVQNTGAAFGIFTGKANILSIITGVLILIIIIYSIINRNKLIKAELLSLSFIASGGLGNLISRLTQGFVTDMFDFHFWPVFNVADIFVCVGCALLIISVFIIEPKQNGK